MKIQIEHGRNRSACIAPVTAWLMLVAGWLTLPGFAGADSKVYRTGFETPTFQVDGTLLGTDGWSLAIPPFLNPDAARITADAARRGVQSVVVDGADLQSSGGATGPYDAVGSYRRPVNIELQSRTRLARVDADLFLEKNQPNLTPGEFFSLTLAARSGAGETLGEIGLSSQGIVEGWDFESGAGDSPTYSRPIRINKWYHITILLDFDHRTTAYFVDEHFLGAFHTTSTSDVLARGSMNVYARPDGGDAGGPGSRRDNYKARFDNFRISMHGAAPDM